jgi:hypothetical protein
VASYIEAAPPPIAWTNGAPTVWTDAAVDARVSAWAALLPMVYIAAPEISAPATPAAIGL